MDPRSGDELGDAGSELGGSGPGGSGPGGVGGGRSGAGFGDDRSDSRPSGFGADTGPSDLDSATDLRALFSTLPDGPPLSLSAADVITDGARIRRRRKRLAVAASSVATAAVLVVAGLAVGFTAGRHGPGTPVQPAAPGLSTVAPPPPKQQQPPVVPPSAVKTTAGSEATPTRSPAQTPGRPISSVPRAPGRIPPPPVSSGQRGAPPVASTR
ncbi:hypothetical protein ACWEOE_08950 [Amycolatopsis sp. NPDC004368]